MWHSCVWLPTNFQVSGFQLQKIIKIHISYWVGLSASRPTPYLEDQAIPFSLCHYLELSGTGGLAIAIYRQDSSQYHMTTQAQIQYCDYCIYWHLLDRLWKYVTLIRWSRVWDVADPCFFHAHQSCKGVTESLFSTQQPADQFSTRISILCSIPVFLNLCETAAR